jgi:FMN-binding domain
MKRAAWYLVAGTVAGFAGVLVLHGRGAPTAQSAAAGTGGGAGPTQAGQVGPSAGPSPASQPARSSPAGAGGPAHSAAGATEQFGYGKLAVKVSLSGSRVVNVTVPVLQTLDPTSQQISEQAIPMLRSQVLAADGAHINGVSGATFTSQAYVNSVQAALDKLNLK